MKNPQPSGTKVTNEANDTSLKAWKEKLGDIFFLNEGIQNHPLFENLESHIHVRAKHKPRKCLAKLLALATFSHKQKMKAKAVLCNLNAEEVPWHMINQQRLEGFVCFPFSSCYYFLLSFLIFFFFFRGSWYPKHPQLNICLKYGDCREQT